MFDKNLLANLVTELLTHSVFWVWHSQGKGIWKGQELRTSYVDGSQPRKRGGLRSRCHRVAASSQNCPCQILYIWDLGIISAWVNMGALFKVSIQWEIQKHFWSEHVCIAWWSNLKWHTSMFWVILTCCGCTDVHSYSDTVWTGPKCHCRQASL